MKIFTIVGARPQFIKAAPMSLALRQQHHEFLVHTGQHYDDAMSDIFFRQLGIPQPDVNLGIGSGSHAVQTAGMMVDLERLMLEQSPDWVLVYGDTNSTLAAALAASKIQVRVAHVEAGLRSFNRAMPEEINRVLTDHVADMLFCPTDAAVSNLAAEGVTRGVVRTGDIMADTVLRYQQAAQQESQFLDNLGLEKGAEYILATIHRPVNADSDAVLAEIMSAFNTVDIPVIFPVHPRTRGRLLALSVPPASHVHLVEPVGYFDMLALNAGASVIVTDSGGLQKEAYLLETPCVTVRSETEWVETVEAGWNRLARPERVHLGAQIAAARADRPVTHPDFYGDGHAAETMVKALEKG
jgi:UDP-GlcNAc3NAcA epimerase